MRTFRHLLAVAALLAGGVYTANAQVMIETDLTSQFNSLATTSWTGSSGQVDWAAPKVTTNSGLYVAAWENYCGDWNGGCTNTGTIMKTTVSGLTAGTYKIELYGAAAFTFNRGFGSEAFTGESTVGGKATSDTYTAGQSIDTETGVYLYATTSEGTYSQEIPIWYADNFNGSGLSTAVLNGVVVGANGKIEIGMSKTSKSTNWHVVQLKGVTATVDAAATFAYYKSEAEALYDSPMNASLLQDLKNAAGVDLSEADAELYKTSIETLAKLVLDAKASIANYAVAKEILDAANGYDKDGKDSYVADETISALLAAYNGGTLEEVTAEQKTAAKAALATACKAQTQPADGCDMTAFIINSDFDSGNTDGWTKETPYGGNCAIQGGSRMEYWAGNASNRALASFNIYQKLTGLPSGAYTITAEMYNSLNDEGGNYIEFSPTCGIYGVSSNEKVALVTEEGTTLKPYTTEEVLVINGELIIGAKNTVTPMAARWFLFDNVKLTYAHQLSADDMIAIATEQYREVLAAAQAVDLTTKMNATTKSDFETALDTYAEDKVVTPGATVASIQEAIDELNNQVAAVEASVNTYAATAQALETYSAKAAALDADGQAAFDVAAIQTAYDNGTMVDDMTADVAVAFRRAVKAQTTPGADMTGAIINPSFEEAGGNGWTATGVNNIHGGAANNYCAESWQSAFTLSQTITDLPNGVYAVTAQAALTDYTDAYDGTDYPVVYANEETLPFNSMEEGDRKTTMGKLSGSFSAGKYVVGPINVKVTDGTLTIGVKGTRTNTWCIFDNFQLVYAGPVPPAFPEEGAVGYLFNVQSKLLVNANGNLVGRTLADKDADLFTVWRKGSDKTDGSEVRLAAGKTGDKWNALRFNDKGLVVCETEDYSKWKLEKDGSYWLLKHNYDSSNGGADATGNVGKGYLTVNPETRMFEVTAESTDYSLWQFITWEEYESLTTTIGSVSEKAAQKGIFNVAGQQMKALQKGLNIVDGKKIYVK